MCVSCRQASTGVAEPSMSHGLVLGRLSLANDGRHEHAGGRRCLQGREGSLCAHAGPAPRVLMADDGRGVADHGAPASAHWPGGVWSSWGRRAGRLGRCPLPITAHRCPALLQAPPSG